MNGKRHAKFCQSGLGGRKNNYDPNLLYYHIGKTTGEGFTATHPSCCQQGSILPGAV